MEPLGDRHHVIRQAQLPQEEGLPAEVVLDRAARPVVGDVRPRLAPPDAEEGVRLARRPAPLPQGAAGLDPVGDAISLADDRHVVTTPNPIDRFGEGPVQVVVEHPVEDAGVHRVDGPPGLGRRPCAVPPKGGRSQEKGEGKNQEPATRKGLPGHE